MSCPICGKPAATRFRPFCCARCADVDLAHWLRGDYRIPADEVDTEGGSIEHSQKITVDTGGHPE